MNADCIEKHPAIDLVSAHPWLALKPRKQEYLPPQYYDRILPEYVCDGLPDTSFLREFLKGHAAKSRLPALELGPGTGRCTEILFDERPELHGSLDLMDQSATMIEACVQRFGRAAFRNLYQTDAISGLSRIGEQYSTIVSMWSLSHSVHQHWHREGNNESGAALRRLFAELLAPAGRFFIMHFDALSEEQRISLRQRRRLYPFFRPDEQSPSFQVLSQTLQKLKDDGVIAYETKHYRANPIVYRSIEHALEVFMNFHMEAELNQCAATADVLTELERDLIARRRGDGTIAITPAWFIFQGARS